MYIVFQPHPILLAYSRLLFFFNYVICFPCLFMFVYCSWGVYEKLLEGRRTFAGHRPITELFQPKEKFSAQKRGRRSIVNFITKCDQPLLIVDREAFREMVEMLELRFVHLSRSNCIMVYFDRRCTSVV